MIGPASYRCGDPQPLEVLTLLDLLRGDPRFDKLLADLGLDG